MEISDYKLWTGETVNFSEVEWQRIVSNASSRLASFLCLAALPSPMEDDLQELLANFIAAVLKRQGDHAEVTTKRVRNFTISFSSSSAANAFARIAQDYQDTISKYSECGSGFDVERNARYCCGRF